MESIYSPCIIIAMAADDIVTWLFSSHQVFDISVKLAEC